MILKIFNCLDKIFLTKSLTNNDPFEQAHTDRFVLDNVQLEDIDKIKYNFFL